MEFGKVFISSILNLKTEDLRAERNRVRTVVDSYPFLRPWAFEIAPASTEKLDDSYLRHIVECDLFILILGEKITDPVTAEFLKAKDLDKPTLIFAKDSQNRSVQANLLLHGAGVKYTTFETIDDLEAQVRDAIGQTLILGLRSLRLGPGSRSLITQLRGFAGQKQRVRIRPIIPSTAELDIFVVNEVEPDKAVLMKASHTVVVPTARVMDILPGDGPDLPVVVLRGRLQLVTPSRTWKFFEQEPPANAQLGFGKVSAPEEPRAQTVIQALRSAGHETCWDWQHNVSTRLAYGWYVVYDDDGRYFAYHADREPQILFVKFK
jgi:hypothetical protein